MVDIYSKLSPEVAQKIIRGIATNGSIVPTYHVEFESGSDRNCNLQDVTEILKNGIVKDQPEYDKNHQNWKYRVEGKSIDGDDSIVITVILSYNELRAITIFPA